MRTVIALAQHLHEVDAEPTSEITPETPPPAAQELTSMVVIPAKTLIESLVMSMVKTTAAD